MKTSTKKWLGSVEETTSSRDPPRKALDGGVLIALASGEPSSAQLAIDIREGRVKAYCSELALAEMLYILCRKVGWARALEKKDEFLASRMVSVEASSMILGEAAREKCHRTIAIQDCFTIALARSLKCEAVFARQEPEMSTEEEKEPFDIKLSYLPG